MISLSNESFSVQIPVPATLKGVNFLRITQDHDDHTTVLERDAGGWNVDAVYDTSDEGSIHNAVLRCYLAQTAAPHLHLTNLVRIDYRRSPLQAVPIAEERGPWIAAFATIVDRFLDPRRDAGVPLDAPVSRAASTFIVGNEPNGEGGAQDYTTPDEYVDSYLALWNDPAIQARRERNGVRLLVAGPAPWHNTFSGRPPDAGNAITDVQWMGLVASALTARGGTTDGFAIHTYLSPMGRARPGDPEPDDEPDATTTPDFIRCPDPEAAYPAEFQSLGVAGDLSFQDYRQYIYAIDQKFRASDSKVPPIYITEFDTRGAFQNWAPSRNYGSHFPRASETLMESCYREVRSFNANPSVTVVNPDSSLAVVKLARNWSVHCLCWFTDDPSAAVDWSAFALSNTVPVIGGNPSGLRQARIDFMNASGAFLLG